VPAGTLQVAQHLTLGNIRTEVPHRKRKGEQVALMDRRRRGPYPQEQIGGGSFAAQFRAQADERLSVFSRDLAVVVEVSRVAYAASGFVQ
jgi:hypothetical protein